ncbi:hypothetical protein KKH56_07815 [bacterium]|nr:hypothetical protein [bacterium]MBU2461574.1 hypothetical protein [bacterium]
MKKIGLVSIFLVFGLVGHGFCQEAVTNSQILEKLNSLEVKIARLEKGQKSLQKQMDSLDKRIDDLRNLLYVILAGMFALVGFVIWDRRTALAPAVKKIEILEEREKTVEKILKEFALKEPKLAAVMRNVAL